MRSFFEGLVDRERVVLIPGMGADERLFEPQRRAWNLNLPTLLMPRSAETLADYAARMRDAMDLAGPCVIGGVSLWRYACR